MSTKPPQREEPWMIRARQFWAFGDPGGKTVPLTKVGRKFKHRVKGTLRPRSAEYIARVRDRFGWEAWRQEQLRAAEKKSEADTQNWLATQIGACRMIQTKAVNALQGEHGLQFTQAPDAVKGFETGVKTERLLTGESTENVAVTLADRIRKRHADRLKKRADRRGAD